MKLVRLVMVTLCAAAGLVVFTQVPAVACSCAGASTVEQVDRADVVFTGTLTKTEQTDPGGDDVISSGDPVFYSFAIEETFKGDAGDGVVESVRDGATCGLEGMRVDQSYVVFAAESTQGDLEANLCGGTSAATPRLVGAVRAALAPAPTGTEVPEPSQPVPTQVPSGVATAIPETGGAAWAWLGGGVLLAVVGGAAALRLRMR